MPLMAKQVDIFIQRITSTDHQLPIDVKDLCSYLSFDIVGLLSFGYALNLQTNEENWFLVKQHARINHRMNVFMQTTAIPHYKLHHYINLLFRKKREQTARLIETMIRSRMAADTHAHRHIYSGIGRICNVKDDEGLRLGDLWYEEVFFIIADSLAGPPCFFFFYYTPKLICLYRMRYIRHGPDCYIFLFIADPIVLLKARYRDPSGIPNRK